MADERPILLIVASLRARTDASSALLRLVRGNLETFRRFRIHTTRGTGDRLVGTGLFAAEDLVLHRRGRSGGIAELAAIVARRECAAAILLLDPSDPWSDAVENRALKRVLIQLQVRLMTTYAAAQRWLTLEAAAQAASWRPTKRGWKPVNWVDGMLNVEHRNPPRALDDLTDGEASLAGVELVQLDVGQRTIALISHDRMKLAMIDFVNSNSASLARHQRILTTGTTGWLLKLLFASPDRAGSLVGEVEKKGDAVRIGKIFEGMLVEGGQDEPRKARKRIDTGLLSTVREALGISVDDAFVDKVLPLPSGPKGGDVLVAEAVLENKCHTILFFHDPEQAHPHSDDIRLLEHTSQLPGVFCECVSDPESAKWWIGGLKAELGAQPPTARNLAQELRHRFALHEAIVVACEGNADGPELASKLAHSCAGYFNQRLINLAASKRERVRIGIGWGFGPRHVLEKLREMRSLVPSGPALEPFEAAFEPAKRLVWSPVIGTLTPEVTDRDPSTKAQDYGIFYGGSVDAFPCAGFVRDGTSVPRTAAELIDRLEKETDLLLNSASPWDAETRSTLYADTGVNPKYFPDSERAVGMMSGIVFDEDGREVTGDYQVVGLRLDGYRAAAERGAVVLICGGKKRNRVALALLRAQVVSTLVTTTDTATWLLANGAAGVVAPTA